MRTSRRGFAMASTALLFVWHARAAAQSTTPAADIPPASEQIGALLRLLPKEVLGEPVDVLWVDVERQFAHFGVNPSDDANAARAILRQSQFGNLPPLFQTASKLEAELGFSELNVLQALAAGLPPHGVQVAVLNRRVDELPEVWEAAGYERRENEAGDFWTIGEEGEISRVHPVQQAAIASLNNIAVLDERTVAFAPTAELLEQIMVTKAGNASTSTAGFETLTTALPHDAISAWLLDGTLLGVPELQIADALAESDEAVGPMPVIHKLSTGITAGAFREESEHDPDARAFLIVQTDEPGLAEQAAAVVTWRMENLISQATGAPFSELIGDIQTELVSEDIALLSSVQAASRGIFFAMIMRRDSLPFAFVDEE